jgi:hypothetical protein
VVHQKAVVVPPRSWACRVEPRPSASPFRLTLPQFVLPVFTSEREISFGFAVAKLAVPSFIMWLLGFYSVFHAMLNVCGELTAYPDRRFYMEWWNATTVDDFWRKWNIPVHEFCLRHIYLESIHYKIAATRSQAAFATFLFSALFHEYVMALTFRSLRGYFFWGMVSNLAGNMV